MASTGSVAVENARLKD